MMKQILSMFLTLLLVGSLLSACASTKSTEQPSGVSKAGTTTITVETTATTAVDDGTTAAEMPDITTSAATTTVPTPSKPTGTKAPTTGKTEPPKTPTTTATVKDKLVITADESDDYFDSLVSEGSNSRYGNYISHALQAKMEQYDDTDALYAVIVRVFVTDEDFFDGEKALGLDETHEEMIRLNEELELARQICLDETLTDDTEQLAHYYAIREACTQLCAELYGNVDEIEDQAVRMRLQEQNAWWEYNDASVEYMRQFRLGDLTNDELGTLLVQTSEKREKASDLSSAYSQFRSKMLRTYVTPILQQRMDVLTDVCDTNLVQTSSGSLRVSYYAELPAEVIKTLAKQGGYAFRLCLEDGSDLQYG